MNKNINFEVVAGDRQEFWRTIYSDYHENNTSKVPYRREALARIIKNNKIGSILELGCNSGGNLLYIMKECPTIQAVGMDINERAIEYGLKVEKNTANLQVGSIYDLTRFADKSFDVVFTCTCLLHIPHTKIQDILKEMMRIAKHHTINIERHGEDIVQSYYGDNGPPHAFAHNYISRYASLGLRASMMDMPKITGHKAQGGADHFVWTNLTDKKLIL